MLKFNGGGTHRASTRLLSSAARTKLHRTGLLLYVAASNAEAAGISARSKLQITLYADNGCWLAKWVVLPERWLHSEQSGCSRNTHRMKPIGKITNVFCRIDSRKQNNKTSLGQCRFAAVFLQLFFVLFARYRIVRNDAVDKSNVALYDRTKCSI